MDTTAHRLWDGEPPGGRRVKTCTVGGCDRRHDARGLCKTHYSVWRIHGDPLATSRRPSVADRFFAKVDVGHPLGCWEWTGSRTKAGYGHIKVGGRTGKNILAHRLVLDLLSDGIPNRMQVDHLCRNRGCVNPDHLEVVTQAENIARGEGVSSRHRRRQMAAVGVAQPCPEGT